MVESRRFICPSCTAILNEDDPSIARFKAILRGPGFEVESVFGLPSELGVYGAEHEGWLKIEKGCRVEFHCPDCGRDFTTSYNDDLAEVGMVEDGQDFVVVFSKVFGEESSFVVDSTTKKLVAAFGDDADAYFDELGRNVNFFGS